MLGVVRLQCHRLRGIGAAIKSLHGRTGMFDNHWVLGYRSHIYFRNPQERSRTPSTTTCRAYIPISLGPGRGVEQGVSRAGTRRWSMLCMIPGVSFVDYSGRSGSRHAVGLHCIYTGVWDSGKEAVHTSMATLRLLGSSLTSYYEELSVTNAELYQHLHTKGALHISVLHHTPATYKAGRA